MFVVVLLFVNWNYMLKVNMTTTCYFSESFTCFQLGLLDYEAAQKLSPDDNKIKEDAQHIRNFLEKNQDFS